MASIDDVMTAMVDQIALLLTAKGEEELLPDYRVYMGWPHPEELARDLTNKVVNISVYTDEIGEKLKDSFIMTGIEVEPPVVNLTATQSAAKLRNGAPLVAASATITLAGSVNNGVFTLFKLTLADGLTSYYASYKPIPGDTLTNVAAGLTAAINASTPMNTYVTAASVGAVVTVTANVLGEAGNLIALDFSIGGEGKMVGETRRQSSIFEVHVWAYDHPSRRLISDIIDNGFAQVHFLCFPDHSAGRLTYSRSKQTDAELRHGIYRRMLYYRVEYGRTLEARGFSVLEGLVTVEVEDC
jgi:hypothetical protein